MYAQKQGMEHQELKAKLSSSCSQGQKQFQSHKYEDRDAKWAREADQLVMTDEQVHSERFPGHG